MNHHWILVVEDDIRLRTLTTRILEGAGYTVATAGHGGEAIRVLEHCEHLPSLILLDLMMPIMPGEQFLAIQQVHPMWSTIPVVLTSGSLNSSARTMSLSGANYLAKPYNPMQLLDMVARYAATTRQEATLLTGSI